MFKSTKRSVPGLNTAATADISFMLLIFFLVTSSMDSDKGLARQLPPLQNEQMEQELRVKERNVLRIGLDADNRLLCNGEPTDAETLTRRVVEFVANKAGDPSLPEMSVREVNFMGRCEVSDRHVLLLQVSRSARYEAYFQVQDAIARAYNQLRDGLAMRQFRQPYAKCTAEQRSAVAMVYPQRISEEVQEEQ